jgi:hypothetical protein
MPTFQSAYRRGHSPETVLLKVVSAITAASDSGCVSLLTLLDMSSAFDTVDFSILLKRLDISYEINGSVLRLLSSFGSGRAQAVSFMDCRAGNTPLQYWVPQGSVLRPLLFLLYTADVMPLAETAGINVHAYGDDIQLYFHEKSTKATEMIAAMSDSIVRTADCMSSNRLRINNEKTQILWLGSRHQLAKLS